MNLYIETMRDLINCGIQNSITTSKYGSQTFLDETFDPKVEELRVNYLANFNTFWSPEITNLVMFVPFINIVGCIAYVTATLYLLLGDWGPKMDYILK